MGVKRYAVRIANRWLDTCVPIASLEDLSDAVLRAGLEVTQMSRAPVKVLRQVLVSRTLHEA